MMNSICIFISMPLAPKHKHTNSNDKNYGSCKTAIQHFSLSITKELKGWQSLSHLNQDSEWSDALNSCSPLLPSGDSEVLWPHWAPKILYSIFTQTPFIGLLSETSSSPLPAHLFLRWVRGIKLHTNNGGLSPKSFQLRMRHWNEHYILACSKNPRTPPDCSSFLIQASCSL